MDLSELLINIHRVGSSAFTLVGLFLIFRSVRGWRKRVPYTRTDRTSALIILVILYIQLVAGLLLYFVYGSQRAAGVSIQAATRALSIRTWALEHFIIMIFGLLLSQLGWVFISNSKLDVSKHKNTLFYFGTSVVLIVITTAIGLIFR